MVALAVGASTWFVVVDLALRRPVLSAAPRTPGMVPAPVLSVIERLAVETADGLADERLCSESFVLHDHG